jgi:hypothetical protein
MVWEQRMRRISWIFFTLMWIPLAVVIYAAVTGEPEPPVPAIAALILSILLFAFLLAGSYVVGGYEKAAIRANGIPAKATITAVSDTGTRVNNRPVIRIELDVSPPYDSRFNATVEYIVPRTTRDRFQPGMIVPVFYMDATKEVALADL